MNDYRCKGFDHARRVLEGDLRRPGANDAEATSEWRTQYATWDPPADRIGLIAMLHPLLFCEEKHVEQLNKLAEEIAVRTGQRVYITATESRWHILQFAKEDGSWDGDDYRDSDQFIGYYDPDGSWHFVGAS